MLEYYPLISFHDRRVVAIIIQDNDHTMSYISANDSSHSDTIPIPIKPKKVSPKLASVKSISRELPDIVA